MLHILSSYLKYLIQSTNQHGIHSPFVYNFITQCLYNKKLPNTDVVAILSRYRNALLKNSNTIQVTDFGAGSKVFKSNTRKISAIAKNAGISAKRANLLCKIVNYFQPIEILEIGTSLGIATSCLALGNKNAKIISLEGCPATADVAKQQLKKIQLTNVDIKIGSFDYSLPKLTNKSFDLVFFDGNHTKKATISYFEQLKTTANNETIFIFDDIHWNKEMEEAWNYIKNDKKVTVSIDTYQWGIVFFRKEQPKEHFTIRI